MVPQALTLQLDMFRGQVTSGLLSCNVAWPHQLDGVHASGQWCRVAHGRRSRRRQDHSTYIVGVSSTGPPELTLAGSEAEQSPSFWSETSNSQRTWVTPPPPFTPTLSC